MNKFLLTTARSPLQAGLRDNLLLISCIVFYLGFWTYYAINPVWRPQWWLDNYLVFGIVVLLVGTYRRFPLSNLSYVFLTVFMCFHAVGANMSYSNVPLGFWMSHTFGFERPNVYDRLVHFLFGVFFAYPIHEVLRRYTTFSPAWWYILPVEFIISYSALYEIIEAATAWSLPPEQYDPFVGLQGDIWDGYRDMTCALCGAFGSILVMMLNGMRTKSWRFKPESQREKK